MLATAEQPVLDFYTYPPVGTDDWRYTFQVAVIRALEMQILTKPTLLDMSNAASFEQAVDLLSATEYALPSGTRNFTEMENVLQHRRSSLRQLFADLILDEPIVELFKARDDFANLRLALRRTLTEKPVGTDYSPEGNVPPGRFAEVFEEENYELFPAYIAEACELAILAYYQDKDIRRIDYAIDAAHARYNLNEAHRLKSVFLLNLFRIQIDLTNIRTLLRLKFTESELRNVFLQGGFIEQQRLQYALDIGYEGLGSLFFVLPYYQLVESSASYLISDKSFLRAEQLCSEFLTGFLKSTVTITAGPQPVIAYLLMKENEIRNIRLILTAKKNFLDTKLILDRIS